MAQHSSTFLGRERELAELAELLADPACRLITILGPGGVGKTRLALEAAARERERGGSAVPVPLQALADSADLPATIAAAAGVALNPQLDPILQLAAALQAEPPLLVLDNFEQLLDGVDILLALLDAAPGLKLLVTSREVLNVQEEWLYPLEGLAVPEQGEATGEAAALFVDRARRVRPGFQLDHTNQAAVARICRAVDGLPLAIELAAGWAKTLSCAEIADELARGIDLLSTTLRNANERHRSMRGVLDQSWALLTGAERQAFQRLTLFRTSFTREAATRVAAATLPVLSGLVDTSMLRLTADGRYHLHELLRQYGAERLAADPDAHAAAHRALGDYYAVMLAGLGPQLQGASRPHVAQAISVEFDNVRAAWPAIVAHGDDAVRQAAVAVIGTYYQMRGPYPFTEGIAAMELALEQLQAAATTDEDQLKVATVQQELGHLHQRVGHLDLAVPLLEAARATYNRLEAPPPPGHATDPVIWLSAIEVVRGAYQRAAELGAEAVRRAETLERPRNRAPAWFISAEAAWFQGRYEEARRYAERACASAEELADHWVLAPCLVALGAAAFGLGRYADAHTSYREAYSLAEQFADLHFQAFALVRAGELLLNQEQYAEAEERFSRSARLYEQTGDRSGTAWAWAGLGASAVARSDLSAASRRLNVALEAAAALPCLHVTFLALTSAVPLLRVAGKPELADDLLALASLHPGCSHLLADQARRQLGARTVTPTRTLADAITETTTILHAITRGSIAVELHSPTHAAPEHRPPAVHLTAGGGLVEPLSQRELEILGLVGSGLSNQAIADRLIISVGTVKWHVNQMFSKLDVGSRTQAVARARELGLLP